MSKKQNAVQRVHAWMCQWMGVFDIMGLIQEDRERLARLEARIRRLENPNS